MAGVPEYVSLIDRSQVSLLLTSMPDTGFNTGTFRHCIVKTRAWERLARSYMDGDHANSFFHVLSNFVSYQNYILVYNIEILRQRKKNKK